MAKMTTLRCPYCDAALEVTGKRAAVTCEYCGSTLPVTGTEPGKREVSEIPERTEPVPEPGSNSTQWRVRRENPLVLALAAGFGVILYGIAFDWSTRWIVGIVIILVAAGILLGGRTDWKKIRTGGYEPGSEGVLIRDKWTAFFLCLFLGWFGAHKFYEGRIGMGLIYLFTVGLFGYGWFTDLLWILAKPRKYAV